MGSVRDDIVYSFCRNAQDHYWSRSWLGTVKLAVRKKRETTIPSNG